MILKTLVILTAAAAAVLVTMKPKNYAYLYNNKP
jgi:hypothetical protein